MHPFLIPSTGRRGGGGDAASADRISIIQEKSEKIASSRLMKRLLTVALKWLPLEVAKSEKQRKQKEFFGMAEGPESRPVHRRAIKGRECRLIPRCASKAPKSRPVHRRASKAQKVDLYTDVIVRLRKQTYTETRQRAQKVDLYTDAPASPESRPIHRRASEPRK